MVRFELCVGCRLLVLVVITLISGGWVGLVYELVTMIAVLF